MASSPHAQAIAAFKELQRLSEQAAAAPPDAVLHSSAGDALRHLKLLARLGSEGSRGGGDKGVSAAS